MLKKQIDMVFLTHEDICQDISHISVLEKYGFKRRFSTLKPIENYVHSNKKIGPEKYKKKIYDMLPEDRQFIIDNLDWDTENELGYFADGVLKDGYA